MIDSTSLYLYLAALTAVYLVPGPDMAMVMAASASRGLRAGMYTAVGISVARFLHVLGSGLGLAALFAKYPAFQDIIKLIGAAYLLYLAWKIINTKGSKEKAISPSPDFSSDIVRGFLTNLLNPKALLFCGLLLPQFVSPERGPLLAQFLGLGVVLVLLGFLFDFLYAYFASGLALYFLKKAKKISKIGGYIERTRRWFMASVFTSIAVKLFVG